METLTPSSGEVDKLQPLRVVTVVVFSCVYRIKAITFSHDAKSIISVTHAWHPAHFSATQFKKQQRKKSFHLNIHTALSLRLTFVELEQQSPVGRA